MAAKFHLAEAALALLLSRTRTCTQRSFSIERLMGPMARGARATGAGNVPFGCLWHPRYKPPSIFELVPADGHHGCQLEERRLRYVPVF
jgi:hypothetical protein